MACKIAEEAKCFCEGCTKELNEAFAGLKKYADDLREYIETCFVKKDFPITDQNKGEENAPITGKE
jgi:predicted Fe-S protein YdhL (DUF1289 family)